MADGRPVRRTWVRQPLVDRAVVAGLVVTDVIAQIAARTDDGVTSAPLSVAAVLTAVLSATVLLARRSRPIITLVACGVAAAICAGVVPPGLFTQQAGITIILGAYAIGAWSERRVASVVAPVLALLLLVLGARDDGSDLMQALTIGLAAIGLPWMAGRAARSRRRYVEEVEARLAAAEAERDERARRAVLDERTHIARELHDVVAHHVSLIGVQAGAARTSLDSSPDLTRSALVAIEESSRAAVGEMRTLLGVLRDDGTTTRSPPPGIEAIAQLASEFRAAGLAVELRTTIAPPLSPALGLTCYRIAEEALTNVTRHSGAGRAVVVLDADDAEVRMTVTDPGPSRTDTRGTGRGLVGLGERVALFGGHHSAMPTATGGFEVSVTLPRDTP